jgi:ADP-ribose pyrophosphatase YjhB (NUDIX family)
LQSLFNAFAAASGTAPMIARLGQNRIHIRAKAAQDGAWEIRMALHHRLIGKAARLWWRIRRPRTLGVRAVVLDQRDRIALVRHTYAAQWYLPGGGVKKGESFQIALLRELEEEVALRDARIERILGVYHSRREAKDDHIVIYVVRVEVDPGAGLARADLTEIEEAGWFVLDALPDDVSPATGRRIAEYRKGLVGSGPW